MEKRSMVIFDFDGVIADSWWLTHKTTKKEYPEMTEDLHRQGFEGNIYAWDSEIGHLKRNKIDYFAEYEKEMHLVVFFQVEEVIKELASKYLLSIVSSSTNQVIHSYLTREGLSEFFSDVLGGDVHESKHEKIGMLFARHKLVPSDCVMVTDTVGDVKEARLAGVDSIGVSWGFHEVERLQKVETFRLVHEPHELLFAVNDYFSR